MKTKICKHCGKEFSINHNNRANIFCTHSCAITYNNLKRLPMSDEQKKKISDSLKKKFLENPEVLSRGEKHSKKVGESVKTGKRVKSLTELSSRTIPKILKRLNLGCCICGWKESTCDIHHINGRKIEGCNNHFNLTLLCPNHHRLVHAGKIDKSLLISLDKYLPENWNDLYYG